MVHRYHRLSINIFVCLLLVLASSGCQAWPEQYVQGVDQLTVEHKVRNARAQRIKGWPGLRVDSSVASYLNAALQSDDLETSRQFAITFLKMAHDLALQTATTEILRLELVDVTALQKQYFPDQLDINSLQLVHAYTQSSNDVLNTSIHSIEQKTELSSLKRELQVIADHIEKPLKYQGKTGRILTWLPFYLPSKIAAEQVEKNGPGCPLFLGGFEKAHRYNPPVADQSLLARYAPVIIVEENPQAKYGEHVDQIGQVVAIDADHVQVQTESPAVYSFVRQLILAGKPHKQLVYIAWFPKHPNLSSKDPLAGHIDGFTVRISLNTHDIPMLIETMANCGCFHGLYPTAELESSALNEFGPPADDAIYALERKTGQILNAHIPGLLESTDQSFKPVVYVAAGWHSIVHVTLDPPPAQDVKQQTYLLSPYQNLELLPVPSGGYTSMFYDNGLVRHAQRPEGVYFTPMGMLSAGQPRQRETQLIYWDQYDFDEPDLLSRLLRLPSNF